MWFEPGVAARFAYLPTRLVLQVLHPCSVFPYPISLSWGGCGRFETEYRDTRTWNGGCLDFVLIVAVRLTYLMGPLPVGTGTTCTLPKAFHVGGKLVLS